jgi:hypothetical protein
MGGFTTTDDNGGGEHVGVYWRRWGLLKCFGERRYGLAVVIPKVPYLGTGLLAVSAILGKGA